MAVIDNYMARLPQPLNNDGSHTFKDKHEYGPQNIPICGQHRWIYHERCCRNKASAVEEEPWCKRFNICNARGEHLKLEQADEGECELFVYTKFGRCMIEQGQLHGWLRDTKVTYLQRNGCAFFLRHYA